MPQPTIGAEKESLKGPGVLTHEGGDDILVALVEDGLPQNEHALCFEGEEVIIDGDDEFHPADASSRSIEIGEAAVVRALGQANYSFKKKAAKKEAAKVAA